MVDQRDVRPKTQKTKNKETLNKTGRFFSAGGMMYRSRVKCKLQVSVEIKTKRRVNTAQGKKKK